MTYSGDLGDLQEGLPGCRSNTIPRLSTQWVTKNPFSGTYKEGFPIHGLIASLNFKSYF